jgi:hypothetical protein
MINQNHYNSVNFNYFWILNAAKWLVGKAILLDDFAKRIIETKHYIDEKSSIENHDFKF